VCIGLFVQFTVFDAERRRKSYIDRLEHQMLSNSTRVLRHLKRSNSSSLADTEAAVSEATAEAAAQKTDSAEKTTSSANDWNLAKQSAVNLLRKTNSTSVDSASTTESTKKRARERKSVKFAPDSNGSHSSNGSKGPEACPLDVMMGEASTASNTPFERIGSEAIFYDQSQSPHGSKPELVDRRRSLPRTSRAQLMHRTGTVRLKEVGTVCALETNQLKRTKLQPSGWKRSSQNLSGSAQSVDFDVEAYSDSDSSDSEFAEELEQSISIFENNDDFDKLFEDNIKMPSFDAAKPAAGSFGGAAAGDEGEISSITGKIIRGSQNYDPRLGIICGFGTTIGKRAKNEDIHDVHVNETLLVGDELSDQATTFPYSYFAVYDGMHSRVSLGTSRNKKTYQSTSCLNCRPRGRAVCSLPQRAFTFSACGSRKR